MGDPELDDLLRSSAPRPSQVASDTAVLLARQSRPAHSGVTPLRARPRRRPVIAAAVAGSMALTGAGTLAAHQLGIPPFQSLEAGVERTVTGIPVTYTNSLNRKVECQAYIEYSNVDPAQRERIDQVARDGQWEGYGQRVLDRLALPDAPPEEQNRAVAEVVHDDLWHAVRAAVPTMRYMQESDGPVYSGSSMSCAGPGGVDGRP